MKPTKPIHKFLTSHHISDGLIKDFCNKGLYLIASKEIPRAIDTLNREISDLRHLEKLLLKEWYKINPEENPDA